MPSVTRRSFLQTAAAIGATAAWGNPFRSKSGIAWRERRDVFPEGVASGDPDSNSVLLWTRRPPTDKSGNHSASRWTHKTERRSR